MSKLQLIEEKSPWYSEGLRFECTGCGECCTGAPGHVWVSRKEIKEIAEFLHFSKEEFTERFLRRVGARFSLIELPKTFDCIFLKNKKCTIYSVRPTQCRTFPWWPQLLKSREDWEEAAHYCEGITCQAPVVPPEKISEQATLQSEYTEQIENE